MDNDINSYSGNINSNQKSISKIILPDDAEQDVSVVLADTNTTSSPKTVAISKRGTKTCKIDIAGSPCPGTKNAIPTCKDQKTSYKPKESGAPWQMIILAIVGSVFLIYTAVAPNINSNRRIFGIIMILLWTILFSIILWILWRDGLNNVAWLLSIVPISLLVLFFVMIIVLNM